MIATIERPMLATFAMPLDGGGVEPAGAPSVGGILGGGIVATGGSGGSTMSATSKAGAGAVAGGCASSGAKASRPPGSEGRIGYGMF